MLIPAEDGTATYHFGVWDIKGVIESKDLSKACLKNGNNLDMEARIVSDLERKTYSDLLFIDEIVDPFSKQSGFVVVKEKAVKIESKFYDLPIVVAKEPIDLQGFYIMPWESVLMRREEEVVRYAVNKYLDEGVKRFLWDLNKFERPALVDHVLSEDDQKVVVVSPTYMRTSSKNIAPDDLEKIEELCEEVGEQIHDMNVIQR